MDDFLSSRARVVAGAVALLVLLALAGRYLLHVGTAGSTSLPVAPVAILAAPARTLLYVDVVGAVGRPGLYRLPQGTRISDAVARAGGATRKADLDLVNLAAPLVDGEQVVVPQRGAAGVVAAGSAGVAASGPVSLSTATAEQLDALPGIGPATAQRIIDYRTAHGPFRSVDELDAVPGIGPARLAELRKLVVP
jgi:competence protein ComEA